MAGELKTISMRASLLMEAAATASLATGASLIEETGRSTEPSRAAAQAFADIVARYPDLESSCLDLAAAYAEADEPALALALCNHVAPAGPESPWQERRRAITLQIARATPEGLAQWLLEWGMDEEATEELDQQISTLLYEDRDADRAWAVIEALVNGLTSPKLRKAAERLAYAPALQGLDGIMRARALFDHDIVDVREQLRWDLSDVPRLYRDLVKWIREPNLRPCDVVAALHEVISRSPSGLRSETFCSLQYDESFKDLTGSYWNDMIGEARWSILLLVEHPGELRCFVLREDGWSSEWSASFESTRKIRSGYQQGFGCR